MSKLRMSNLSPKQLNVRNIISMKHKCLLSKAKYKDIHM